MTSKPSLDPYSSFRNDRERRNALVSRDLRIVLVTLIFAVISPLVTTWWY